MSNYASGRIIFAGSSTNTLDANGSLNWDGNKINTLGLSASTDLQVGGHITGSGDLRLLNDGNIRLGGNSVISFDDGAGQFSTISQGGTNQLTIEADNRLTIKADDIIIKDSGGNERF